MGYNTEFEGRFEFSRTLSAARVSMINRFSEERHEDSRFPGIWCDWVASEDGKFLEYNGQEKFTDYDRWLQYLIDTFFTQWGVKLLGTVEYQGEEPRDRGTLKVVKGQVIKR